MIKCEESHKVEEIISKLEKHGAKWCPVGGRKNNTPIINQYINPFSPIIERIMNSQDAIIERRILEEKQKGFEWDKILETPKDAFQTLFQLDETFWEKNISGDDLFEITKRIAVIITDSDKEHFNITIVDDGVGQEAELFPSTFVGLNEDTKITKKYLTGVFGQGGSSSFALSEYTIIISKPPDDLRKKEAHGVVGWTIVRYNDEDPNRKAGTYEYIVDSQGKIFTTKLKQNQIYIHKKRNESDRELVWKEGTIIKMINYKLEGINKIGMPYKMLQLNLFETLYPFSYFDARENIKRTKEKLRPYRPIKGLRRNLDNDDSFEKGSLEVDMEDKGRVVVRFWIVKEKKDEKKVKNRIEANHPIIFTYYGQLWANESISFIKNEMKLDLLANGLILQISLDELNKIGFKEIMHPSRNALKEGPLKKKLYEELSKGVQEHTIVKKYLRLRKEELLSGKIDEKLLRNLKNDLKKELSFWGIPTANPFEIVEDKQGTEPPEEKGIHHYQPKTPPNVFEIVTKQPILAWPGKRILVTFQTNAPDNYPLFSKNLRVNFYKNPPSLRKNELDMSKAKKSTIPVELRSIHNLQYGRFKIAFLVKENAEIGSKIFVQVKFPKSSRDYLEQEFQIKIIEPPEEKDKNLHKKKQKKKGIPSSNIEYKIIEPEDPTTEWDEKRVGDIKYFEEEKKFIIIINLKYEDFKKAITVLKQKTISEAKYQEFRNKYITSISVVLYQQKVEELEKKHDAIDDEIKEITLQWVARGIINALIPKSYK